MENVIMVLPLREENAATACTEGAAVMLSPTKVGGHRGQRAGC